MREGDTIDERFMLVHFAASGGMGDVYRARDLLTGQEVALKLLERTPAHKIGSLFREAQALAMVRLPGVVRYVGHGVTAGQPYLAMEWLSGETLEARLARGPLSIADTLQLSASLARTLGAIHQLGLVHRDLKPGNLLLVGGAIQQVTLIDFGIALDTLPAKHTAFAATVVGTPGYMAPEQVQGDEAVDARADVFALGCVLYECLAGQPAFVGDDPLSLLARVLLENPPGLREIRAETPAWLDGLVGRMLAKSRVDRPRDGDAVSAALAAGDGGEAGALPASGPQAAHPAQKITANERQMMALILIEERAPNLGATIAENDDAPRTQVLRDVVARYGGRLALMQGQWILVALPGSGAPADLAMRAAHCAWAVRAELEGAPMVIVTGRAEVAGRLPVGEIIDRAARLLPRGSRPDAAAIRVDEVTAALLRGRFQTTQDDAGAWIWNPLAETDEAPQLLGRPMPCVGRDRELRQVLGELDRCIEEPVSSVVLVTAPPGVGKSRLRHELLRIVKARGDAFTVWVAQGDPLGARSTFGPLAQALRRALGILDGEPLATRRRKVLAGVRAPASPRIAAFLGELVGAPFPDDDDAKLRAARRSPILMGDQIRAAWGDFLRAECAARPVVLVIEDLQWADVATVNLVAEGLGHAHDLPFFVLALGHPEPHRSFPRRWEEHLHLVLDLLPLSPAASEALVRSALGDAVSIERCAELVDRAEGNAFFLEELLRAAADGGTERLPETVLATVQARFDALTAGSRRVLRAASLFGETFWRGGVRTLVGGGEVDPELQELCGRELVVEQREGRVAGEVEYRFRHTLLREAAYALLTERDRRIGHALAGDWLEQAGEADAMTLAGHFVNGGAPARAAAAYRRAAEEALRGNDLDAAIERAERGVACGPDATVLGTLWRVQAEANVWRGDFALAEEQGEKALGILDRGSAAWFSAAIQVLNATYKQSAVERLDRWTREVLGAPAMSGAVDSRDMGLGEAAVALTMCGRYELAETVFAALERSTSAPAPHEAEVIARLSQARAFRLHSGGDLEGSIAAFEATLAAFEEAGDRRNACSTQLNLGFLHAELGEFAAAETLLRASITAAARMALSELEAYTQQNLGLLLAYRGKVDEGRAMEEAALTVALQLGNLRLHAGARMYLARISLLVGNNDAAEREAREAAEVLQSAPPLRPMAVAVRASALLALGRTAEALADAREAFAALESQGGLEEGETLVRLVHAEALAAIGDLGGAAEVIASARDKLVARAARLRDPARRQRFLRDVPDNARTLERARAWLGEACPPGEDAGSSPPCCSSRSAIRS